MLENAYAIYDAKAATYTRPFYSLNHLTAVREFLSACMNEKTLYSQYPEDFTLFHTGVWDKSTGFTTDLDAKISLGTAHELLATYNTKDSNDAHQ